MSQADPFEIREHIRELARSINVLQRAKAELEGVMRDVSETMADAEKHLTELRRFSDEIERQGSAN